MLDQRSCGRILRLFSWLAVIAALSFWSRSASAYPWMIRHQYQGCVPCHADPSGAGLLTEYGRAQGDVILRMRYGAPLGDDADTSARFLWGVPMPEWLLLGGSVRNGLQYKKDPGGDFEGRYLQMQADFRAQVTLDRIRAYGGLGFMREGARPTQITSGDKNNLVSREHWIGVELGEDRQLLLRAGRIAVPFGVRTNEHELFVRSSRVTRTDINESQQHGVAFAYNGEHARAEVMGILGNYQVNSDAFGQRGYSGYLELSIAPWVSAGVSSLLTYAKNDLVYLTSNTVRQVHGAFARVSPIEQLVILTEADATITIADKAEGGTLTSTGFVGMLQADYEVIQGLHVMATGEIWSVADLVLGPGAPPQDGSSYSGWGTLLWFFAPHADLRFDFVASSLLGSDPSIYLLPQLHVYL